MLYLSELIIVKIVKNKCAPPFRKAEFEIEFGKGINKFSEVIDKAIEFDIIHKSGSWFSYQETKIGQGKASVINILHDNPELFEEIEEQVKNQIMHKNESKINELFG